MQELVRNILAYKTQLTKWKLIGGMYRNAFERSK